MTDRPLITVVMPAYNHELFISEALASLIAQTYEPLELIAVDDGSSDATYDKIQELKPELERRFVRVEIGTKDHEGAVRTISRCLLSAHSDLVFMLDSDDVAHPDAIERLLPCLSAPDVALAVGDNEYIDAHGAPAARERDGESYSTLLAYYTRGRAGFETERDFGSYQSLIAGNYVPNGWLMRRSSVADVKGYADDFILDDWPLLLRLSKKYRLRFAGLVLAKYRLHEKNAIAIHENRHYLDTARILLRERGYCRDHGFEREWFAHAQRIFANITPQQIKQIIEQRSQDDHWSDDHFARVEDLSRFAKHEHELQQARCDLDRLSEKYRASIAQQGRLRAQQEMEHTRLTALLDTAEERLRASEIERQREREHLAQVVSAKAARLAAIESSRTWRWTEPVRTAVKLARHLTPRRWELFIEPAMPDPATLGGLELRGWAFHRDSPVTRLEVSIRGQSCAVEYGIDRPDVVDAFSADDVGRPGFRTSIHAIEDPVTLQITLVCADGRTESIEQRLERTPEVSATARELYGAPDPLEASPLGLVRDLLKYGRLGKYIWDSRRIRGWIRGDGEAEALARASESLGDSPVVVEVGTFLGCSTVLLAGARKRRGSGRIHCVDAFAPSGDDAALPIYRAIAHSLGMPMRQAFELNMRRAGVADWITVHQMTSRQAASGWDTPIDMLYLDGDVSIPGSREIYLDWSPFLRRGGILAINGTVERASRTGSYLVVEEFVRTPDYEDVRRVDHITFARRAGGVEQ